MALGGIYDNGTVTIQPDKVSVEGVGTFWSPIVEVGDWLLCNGQVGLVAVIADETHITLESQWQGTLPSAAAYVIIKMSWLRYDPALTQSKLRELLESLEAQGTFLFVEGDEPDPAMGEDGQWALKTDVQPWQVWLKQDGVWIEQPPNTAILPEGTAGHHWVGQGIGTPASYQGFVAAGAGAVTRTWQDKVRESVSIKDFGAIGDGAFDNYAAISAAMNHARAIGADLFIPSGRYRINMSAGRTSFMIQEMSVRGEHIGGLRGYSPQTSSGAMFHIVGTASSPFTMEYNSTIENVTFIWPDQTTPTTPTIYPAAINISNGSNVRISKVTMVNAYNGINHSSGGFIWISNCRIAAFDAGVRFLGTHAGNVITGCDFSFSAGDDFYSLLDTSGLTKRDQWRAYYSANAFGIHFTGVSADAQSIADNVFFGCKAGVGVTSGSECFLWATLDGNHFDACYWGVLFAGKARPTNFTINGGTFNYQFDASGAGHIVMSVSGSSLDYDMAINGVRFSVTRGTQILIAAPDTQRGLINLTGCNFLGAGWNETGGPFYAVSVSSLLAVVAISGCIFDGLGLSSTRGVQISKAASMTLTGCNFTRAAEGVNIGTLPTATIVGNAAQVTGNPVTGQATNHTEANNSWNPSAWVAYTPSVSAAAGTLTGTANGRYNRQGKTVALRAGMAVTSASGVVYPRISLPPGFIASAFEFDGSAKKITDGTVWGVKITAGSTVLELRKYDNTTPVANGDQFTATIVFELA